MATPKYADIWSYLNPSGGAGAPAGTSAAGQWTPGYYTTEQQGGGEGGAQDVQVWHPGTFTPGANVPDKYKGMLTGYNTSGAGGANPGLGAEDAKSGPSALSGFTYDTALMDKLLPKTKFGDFSKVGTMSLGSGAKPDMSALGDMQMKNPNAMYYDENYGWITPSANVVSKRHFTDTFADTILPMLLSVGFGGIAGAAGVTGTGLGTGAVSVGKGLIDGSNPLAGIMAMFGDKGGGAPTATGSNQGAGGLMALLQLLSKMGKGG